MSEQADEEGKQVQPRRLRPGRWKPLTLLCVLGALVVLVLFGLFFRKWGPVPGKSDADPQDVPAVAAKIPGRIAFKSDTSDPNWDIYTIRPDGSELVQVTDDNHALSAEPGWSRDGRRLTWYGESTGRACIYVADADGSNSQIRSFRYVSPVSPDFSPDGLRIAFAGVGIESLHVADVKGGRGIFVCKGALFPDWAPDGIRILVTDWGWGDVGEICCIDLATGARKRLTSSDKDGRCSRAQWSPDGSRLAYASTKDGTSDIWVMNADGTDQRNLTSSWNTSDEDAPTWSPDGNCIAFDSDKSGNRDIWVMKANGSNAYQVTNSPADESEPDWGIEPASQRSDVRKAATSPATAVAGPAEKAAETAGVPPENCVRP